MMGKIRICGVIGLGALLIAGCDRKEPEQKNAAEVAVVEAADPPAEVAKAEPAKPIATEDEVKALVTQWVKAQNGGDFKGYSKLYAKKFQGTKRVGDRATEFGHDGWLKDREGMFSKPFTVKADDIHVEFTPASAIVGMRQTWKSATYQDEGEKRLQLVIEDGALKISREVMVTSDKPGGGPKATLAFEQGAMVTETANSSALLIPGKVEFNWATEHPVYINDELGERAVAEKALPAKLRELKKYKYEIYDQNGTRCVVQPRGYKISISVSPSYSTLAVWEGNDYSGMESDEFDPVPKERRAIELWQIASASGLRSPVGVPMGLTLALEFDGSPSCPEPVWGRKLTDGGKKEWTLRQATAEEFAQMRAAAPGHPLSQEEADASPEALKRAEQQKGAAKVIESEAGETYFLLNLWSQWEECGGSNAAIGWRKLNDRLVPLKGPQPNVAALLDVRDLNGDGMPEMIDKYSIITRSDNGYAMMVDHEPHYLGCRC